MAALIGQDPDKTARVNSALHFSHQEFLMKYAICNETFRDWEFERAFAYASQLGYTGIEIAPFTLEKDVRNISTSQRQEVKDLAAAHNLEVVGLHWLLAFTEGFYLTSPDAETQKATTDYLCELASLCSDLGGQVMVLGSPAQRNLLDGMSHEQAMDIAAKVIGDATETFQSKNVKLALEPLGPEEGDFLLTADMGIELLKAINHPNVQLHLDVKAMSSESKPIVDIIRDSAEYFIHFHANDANRRGPGMGEIDFVPIIAALKEVGYDDWLSVEVFDYDPGVETLATQSIQNLKKIVEA